MRLYIIISLVTLAFNSLGQYPFEKYPAKKYEIISNWKEDQTNKNENRFLLTIPKFFNSQDSLTILLTSVANGLDSSFITLFRNGKQIQRFFEPMTFDINVFSPVRIADINGDGVLDCKLLIPYMGNGLAALNTRIIYLFLHKDNKFTKISYLDMINSDHAGDNRSERDFNNDGNYEIITTSLINYGNHSYWVYNLYNFKNNDLVNVNNKYNYPILIQFLNRENFKITDKISRQKMKDYASAEPEQYDKK
jgi:hypothetical protein